MRNAVLIVASALLSATVFGAAVTPFAKEEADWRAQREARLRAPDGWLSVAGLFWLREGTTALGSDPQSDIVLPKGAPQHVGKLRMQSGVVTFEPSGASGVLIGGKVAGKQTLKPDTENHPDLLQAGTISLTIIKRGGKTGVRMRNPDAETRRVFTGCKWFPASTKWLVKAKWVPYPEPKKIRITNILGMTDEEPSPGYAEFTTNGKIVRLEPVLDGDELSFMFKDSTSGQTTYAPGRFLDTDLPKNGIVVLDFNKAYNPPCAFTAFATCPLPPKQNNLTVAVDAGEKKYGNHPEAGSR
jgi:uncharacterized protein